MLDIKFDLVTREIMFKNNDFALTANPSVQNGGIILYSQAANPLKPMVGVDILEVIGSNGSKLALEMNRWQAQAKLDGASAAGWGAVPNTGNEGDVNTYCTYE